MTHLRRRHVPVAILFLSLSLVSNVLFAKAREHIKLAVIVNPASRVRTLSSAELAAIFTGALKEWDAGGVIRPLNGPIDSPNRSEFDRVVLKMSPEKSSQFWVDKRVRGEGTPPREVPTPELVARMVAAMPGTIGYIPEDKVTAKTKVVARIRDGKVVAP